jgi:hypothetical protein
MKIAKVQDHPDLVRDLESNAVLNTNYAALLEYRKKQQMVKDMDLLKSEVVELKEMMGQILSLLNK